MKEEMEERESGREGGERERKKGEGGESALQLAVCDQVTAARRQARQNGSCMTVLVPFTCTASAHHDQKEQDMITWIHILSLTVICRMTTAFCLVLLPPSTAMPSFLFTLVTLTVMIFPLSPVYTPGKGSS